MGDELEVPVSHKAVRKETFGFEEADHPAIAIKIEILSFKRF